MRMDVPEAVYIETEEDAIKMAAYFESQNCIGFDTETTGLCIYSDRIKFFSFATDEVRIAGPVYLLKYFKDCLEDEGIDKAMSNGKYDIHMAYNHKINVKGFIWDTVTMSRIQDVSRMRHGLKGTCGLADIQMESFKDVFGGQKDVTPGQAVEYMIRMYRAMHITNDRDDCLDCLVEVEAVDEPREGFFKAYKKLGEYLDADLDTVDYSKILKIARDHGYANKTAGQAGFVADWCDLIQLGICFDDYKERVANKHLVEDPDLKEAAIHMIMYYMLEEVDCPDPRAILVDKVAEYASLDAWASLQLSYVFQDLLEDARDPENPDRSLMDYYAENATDFLRALAQMERNGICLDIDAIDEAREVMEAEVDKIERKMVSIIQKEKGPAFALKFNPGSPKSLIQYFFTNKGTEDEPEWYNKFGNKVRKLTSTGKPSTNATVVQRLADKGDPLANVLLDFRKQSKVVSTYLRPLSTLMNKDGRIRTNLKDFGAKTGRIASSNPNLMNIPKKGEYGKMMRKMFVAAPGKKLIVADYSALEMRLMAHFSGDEEMIKAILEGLDPHCYTASLAQGIDYDEALAAKKAENPTERQLELLVIREHMKKVGYGLLYGIQEVKLGQDLGLEILNQKSRTGRTYQSCPEAKALMDMYYRIYPGVLRYIENTHKYCKKNLFVKTFAGRHIHKPDIVSTKPYLVSAAKREAQNAVIQGTAADIVNAAMIRSLRSELLQDLGVQMLLQVHDELIYEVDDDPDTIEVAMEEVRRCMENPFELAVPITVDMDCADNWGDAK